MEKTSKKGVNEVDLIPMLRRLTVRRLSGQELELDAVVTAKNPSLNPCSCPSPSRAMRLS